MTTAFQTPKALAALRVRDLYLYGSHARGDADERSDRDVLAVVESESVLPSEIADAVRAELGGDPDVAVYGASRLRELYADGELFAWHLHAESECLHTVRDRPLLLELGVPRPYDHAARDLRSLRAVLNEIDQSCRETEVYDAGLLFVVVRNVGVVVTAVHERTPDFSHGSWIRASRLLGVDLPLAQAEYDGFRSCRRAASGPPPVPGSSSSLRNATTRVQAWLREVTRRMSETDHLAP